MKAALVLFLAFLAAACAPERQPPLQQRAVFRPETHAALRDLSARMDRLEGEARCKSSARRLRSGECDRPAPKPAPAKRY